MAQSRARLAALAALGLLGATALALGLALWQRTGLAEWLALRALRERGVPAELRVVQLDLRGAEIVGVRLGPASAPDLALAEAALAWSWEGLRAGRLDRIALRGLRLRARLDDSALRLGALDALLAERGDSGGGALALPFLEARLDDVQAVIDSPQGALRVRADGRATPEGELVRAELTLHGESPQGALDFGGGATVHLATRELAAVGALSGVTPWGRAQGLARADGSLDALRAEFSGSVEPDATALPLRTAAPISLNGSGTRDASGAIDARIAYAANGLAVSELGGAERLAGDATLHSDEDGLVAEASFRAESVNLVGLGRAKRLAGTAQLRGERIEASAELDAIELPELARAPSAKLRGFYDLASGALSTRVEAAQALAPELARLRGFALDLTLAGGALRGDVRVAQLVELSTPALIAPLRIGAQLSGSLERVAFRGKAWTPGDGLALDLSGALATGPGALELKIVLPETDLTLETRQPARVFPWLAGVITAMRGKVGGEALASYANGILGASGVIALNGADIVTAWGTIRGLMGVVAATAIDPLETPPGQTVWMSGVDAGLPLGAGSMKFQLRGGVLEVERGEWGLAQGKLIFAGAIPLDAEERRLELRVEGLSVEALLDALDFEGLGGTGRLAGDAPILLRGVEPLVRGAELRATQTGVIRFRPGESGAALARKQSALAPVLGALEDLHYDELSLIMNGNLADRVDVKLHIRGRNPNYQKGRPVVLNVNVDLPLGSLLRAAAAATGVPDQIEEQVQRAMGEEKP